MKQEWLDNCAWGRFLKARAEMIVEFKKEGASFAEIANNLSISEAQALSIFMSISKEEK